MNFVNLYFGLKLIPIVILIICGLIIVILFGGAIIVDRVRSFKRRVINKK
jgi:uncharacterized membrane protein